MSNLDSINNPFNIKVFFSQMFLLRKFFTTTFYEKKIKQYEEKNPNIQARERPGIFNSIILQTLYIAKKIYGLNDIKINELNKVIIEDFNHVFDEDENENDTASINAKREYDFILKHENISDEFLNDYTTIHNELGYE